MPQLDIKPIEEEMKHSYMDYAMSVIVGRSLPDVRDGLKPVQRRILYSMYEMNLTHDKPFKKCARIVGEVMGKYHPHGEAPIYDALVRMAQPFSLRYTLVDGQGNFGSIDGDSPAAMRYTEARLKKIAEELLDDIDKETVPMMQNFDGSLMEPMVLPAKFPNLLVNGSSGIAVGMATNMPPHNLNEVIDATVYYIKNMNCSIEDLMQFIKGPDFPTGGSILNYSGLIEAYKTGRGTIRIRGKYTIEEGEKYDEIIFTEIPYEVNKSELLQKISELVKNERITGIQNIKDESDKTGIRIVLKLKKDTNPEIVLNQLFEHTQLEVSYGIINLALVDNVPKTFNLKDLITEFVKHRFNVIKKRISFILRKDEEREHILQGYLIALDNLDAVISLIRNSKDYNEAKSSLISNFKLSEIQAKAILDLRLQRLTALERESIINEEKELREEISHLKDILEHDDKIYKIMEDELLEIKKKYGDERKTEIIKEDVTKRDIEDLIPPIDMLVTFTTNGYIKRIPLDEYRSQGRGGSGVITEYGEGDFPKQIMVSNNRDYLLFFTNKGRVYWLKTYKIIQTSRKAVGKNIRNYINLEDDEKVQKILPVKDFDDRFVLFLTKNGIVKKTPLKNFSNPMSKGIIAITLRNDSIVDVALTDDNKYVIIATKNGQIVKFQSKDLRAMGRKGYGVRGIRLRERDEVLSLTIAEDDDYILTVTELGKGKITKCSEYRKTHRGTHGVKGQRISDATGKLVSAIRVEKNDIIMIQTMLGMTIQLSVEQIPEHGRNAAGVKLMDIKENDRVIAITRISID
ncbi:MAG: DNA gyrase subunit A [Thermoplasmata archaeon]|nr:DNA gyrase subunit A [Thermoplasmata archaeon]